MEKYHKFFKYVSISTETTLMKNGQDQINICGYENDAIVYAEVREWKVQQIFFAE